LVKEEKRFFEDEGIRGVNLQLVYIYLGTIAPSFVESKRAFSAAEQTCTEIGSSLNDSTIDCLCFFRAHFIHTGAVDPYS